jgi:hypothetical protein
MKVAKLLKTCANCGGQLVPVKVVGNRQHYKCKVCASLVDAKVKMIAKK